MPGAFPYLGQVENLVFEGGGVKGIAYLGALSRLFESIEPGQIRGVGGTSAGSITALIASFGLDAAEITRIADSLDFSKIPQSPSKDDFPDLSWEEKDLLEAASKLFGGDIWSLYSLYRRYGWYSSDFFLSWLEDTVRAQFERKTGSGTGVETFAQLEAAGFARLRVAATDLSRQETRVLSLETTPDLPVAHAVRMSMSIPLYFESVTYAGDVFVDGGVIANYPMSLFAVDAKSHFATLGFHLHAPRGGTCPGTAGPLRDPAPPVRACAAVRPVSGLASYIESLFESLTVASSLVQPDDRNRTIDIDSYCVGTTDFSIRPRTASYNGLFNNGYAATHAFLTDWPGAAG